MTRKRPTYTLAELQSKAEELLPQLDAQEAAEIELLVRASSAYFHNNPTPIYVREDLSSIHTQGNFLIGTTDALTPEGFR